VQYLVDIPRFEIRIAGENLIACLARGDQPEQPRHRESSPRMQGFPVQTRGSTVIRVSFIRSLYTHAEPAELDMSVRRTRLFLLVGVENRGDAFGIGRQRLDSGALDLQ